MGEICWCANQTVGNAKIKEAVLKAELDRLMAELTNFRKAIRNHEDSGQALGGTIARSFRESVSRRSVVIKNFYDLITVSVAQNDAIS